MMYYLFMVAKTQKYLFMGITVFSQWKYMFRVYVVNPCMSIIYTYEYKWPLGHAGDIYSNFSDNIYSVMI